MRTGTHHKANRNWQNHVREDAPGYSNDVVMLALLMDIREELRGINQTLDCANTRSIPGTLKGIRRDLKARGK